MRKKAVRKYKGVHLEQFQNGGSSEAANCIQIVNMWVWPAKKIGNLISAYIEQVLFLHFNWDGVISFIIFPTCLPSRRYVMYVLKRGTFLRDAPYL